MKVLHVTFGFPPDPPGGTELYVRALCHELEALGIETVVAAPGGRNEGYRHDGLRVRRFVWQADGMGLIELYAGDPAAAQAFEQILEAERPDVVHQHAFTAACSARLVSLAKARGLPVVFTYHTPTTSCQRGTLLEWGTDPCDGRLEVSRCAPCALQGHGLNRWLSRLVACTPERAGEAFGRAGLQGGLWTALRMRSLLRQRIESVQELFQLVDRFVALAPWVEALLRINGVPPDRIVRSPHGVTDLPRASANRPRHIANGRVRVAHLGRLDPTKGTRLLIAAMRAIPDAPIDLDVYGIVQSAGVERYHIELRDLAARDPRIRFLQPLGHEQVVDTLIEYDAVAVPSQWLETGPLVALEAFAAGVPVIASALGGLLDKIHDEVDGLLVHPFNSIQAWTAALLRCAREPNLLARLGAGVRPPPSMTEAARSMRAVYLETLGGPRQDHSAAAVGAPWS